MVEQGDDVKFLTFTGGWWGLQKSNKCKQGQREDPNFGENVKFCENLKTE